MLAEKPVINREKMWTLYDFRKAQEIEGRQSRSWQSLNEFNCKEEKLRTLFGNHHAANMGEGEIVGFVSDIGRWRPVTRNQSRELELEWILWNFVCGEMWGWQQ